MKHQPRIDDDVTTWIKAIRDGYPANSAAWRAVDDLLDDYRMRAAYGYTLTEWHEEMDRL